jgi:hypothetical protein
MARLRNGTAAFLVLAAATLSIQPQLSITPPKAKIRSKKNGLAN